MKRIYKYPLKVTETQALDLPINAEILSVINQQEQLVLYAIVDDAVTKTRERTVKIAGAGNPFNIDTVDGLKVTNIFYNFLGTVSMDDGSLIWHIFIDHV